MRATKYQHPAQPAADKAERSAALAARVARRKARKAEALDSLLTAIAARHLGIETLEPRNMDSLDFHDVGVISLKRALEAAYLAGKASQ